MADLLRRPVRRSAIDDDNVDGPHEPEVRERVLDALGLVHDRHHDRERAALALSRTASRIPERSPRARQLAGRSAGGEARAREDPAKTPSVSSPTAVGSVVPAVGAGKPPTPAGSPHQQASLFNPESPVSLSSSQIQEFACESIYNASLSTKLKERSEARANH